ncbi:interleukin-1 receptor accessory protein-like 1-B [Ptychodera flava]|uniref:interleukin-1 receptor accessory protein-like 1-B n=1 Tax=Ptychodera flava TaxID=63121 RepID=UPI00396A45AC
MALFVTLIWTQRLPSVLFVGIGLLSIAEASYCNTFTCLDSHHTSGNGYELKFSKQVASVEYATSEHYKAIHCCVNSATAHVSWFKNSEVYPWQGVDKEKVYPDPISNSQSLIFLSIVDSDEANYTCRVKEPQSNSPGIQAFVELLVLPPLLNHGPISTSPPDCRNKTVILGADTSVLFHCEFFFGPGSIHGKHLYWMKIEADFPSNRSFINELNLFKKSSFRERKDARDQGNYVSSYLTIDNLHHDALGTYIVRAENDVNWTDMEIHLEEGFPEPIPPQVFLHLFIILVIIILIVAILATIVWYFWLDLQLLYLLHVRPHCCSSTMRQEGKKPFDVFVSYAQDDLKFIKSQVLPKLEREWGFEVRIEDRNFLPGTVYADEVIHFVERSRCCLLLLSPRYLTGREGWCTFQFHVALENTIRLNSKLIILILEDIRGHEKEMDKAMKHVLGVTKCLRWKEEDASYTSKLWKKLHIKLLNIINEDSNTDSAKRAVSV